MTIEIELDWTMWGLGLAIKIGEGFSIIFGPLLVTGEVSKK